MWLSYANEVGLLVVRGLFVIDPNGVVRQMTINDLPVGRSVEETLRLVKAFQFVEKHGEGLLHFLPVPKQIQSIEFYQ